MSRRIAYGALAAAFVLTAAPANADRECFENSCRMPDVVEPPPVQPEPQAESAAKPEAKAVPEAAAGAQPEAAHAKAPVGVHPQMVVDPAPRKPVKQAQPSSPAPRRDANANVDVGPARFPPRPAPRYPTAVPAPVVAASGAPAVARAKLPVPARIPVYAAAVASERPAAAEVVVVRRPGIVHADAGVAPAYAILRPDPAWKRCQIDQRQHGEQYYHCGPYSYHPYGAHGYRPYGTYRNYRSEPAYVLAPNAKIISIDSGD